VTDPRAAEPSTSWAREPLATEPRLRMARDLESADARTFVYVDDKGRVRAPWRYRARQVGCWTLLTLLALGSAVAFIPLGGAWGVIAALIVIGATVHLALLSSWIHRGVVLLAHDRLELADRLLSRAARFSLHQLGIRSLAHQNRSVLAQRRGDHERALSLNRRALALRELWPSPLGRGLYFYLLRYAEVILLCNLDQPRAARQRLAGVPKPPPGEYIRLRRWTAELYLALVEGELDLDQSSLERRTARAERLRTSPELLALCAWGWERLGDRPRALRQLISVRLQERGLPFSPSLPHLARWVDAACADVEPTEPADPSSPGD
jgi:hypothetical protein